MTRLDMWLDQVRRARLNGSIGVVFRIHDDRRRNRPTGRRRPRVGLNPCSL